MFQILASIMVTFILLSSYQSQIGSKAIYKFDIKKGHLETPIALGEMAWLGNEEYYYCFIA